MQDCPLLYKCEDSCLIKIITSISKSSSIKTKESFEQMLDYFALEFISKFTNKVTWDITNGGYGIPYQRNFDYKEPIRELVGTITIVCPQDLEDIVIKQTYNNIDSIIKRYKLSIDTVSIQKIPFTNYYMNIY